MAKTFCPNCDAVITVDAPVEGAATICDECAIELEIICVDPFEVDFSVDYDDEDEDYDDE